MRSKTRWAHTALFGVLAVGSLLVATGPAAAGSPVVAAFRASNGSGQLRNDAAVIRRRLRSLDLLDDHVSARGQRVVITGSERLPVPANDIVGTGAFSIRPVLCYAPPYVAPAPGTVAQLPTTCASAYLLVPPNLIGSSGGSFGVSYQSQPDPALASTPSTSAADDDPTAVALLAGVGRLFTAQANTGLRYLVGPAGLKGRDIRAASASLTTAAGWLITVRFTRAGSVAWETMAKQYFHQILAIDLDGAVVSAPLTEPNTATFIPFGPTVQISGAFTSRGAKLIAGILNSGPLAVPLTVETT